MTTPTRCLAALAALALTCAACSKLPATSSTASTAAPTTTIPGASTPAQTKAADYRAQVTYLMVENVFLLSRVTAQVASGAASAPSPTTPSAASGGATTSTTAAGSTTTAAGGASSTTAASPGSSTTAASPGSSTTAASAPASSAPLQTKDDAGSALDRNSHDLADLLAEPQGYGAGFGSSFYGLWTQRINAFAAYASAKSTKNAAGVHAATSLLASNATDIATLFHEQNKYIAVTTVKSDGLADELTTDNSATTAFIDDQVANSNAAVADTVTAAEGIRHTATVLAAAAAKLDPEQYPGNSTGSAANLRASVTSAFVEHVEVAGLAIDPLVAGTSAGPELAALDANTQQLTNVVTVNFGDPPATTFAKLWGEYVTGLEANAHAKSASGSAPDLSNVGVSVGAFFAAQSPQLSASTIGADTQKMVDALKGYIDAVASSSQPVTQLRVAAATVPKLASDLSEGIAETFPKQYAA